VHKLLLFLFFTLFVVQLKAQDISQYGKKQGIKVTGSLGANTVTYIPIENSPTRLPFAYFLTGRLNINLYGVAVPLSFNYSNQSFNYSTPQPFNIVGLSPTYKNVTVHLGYRNMTFSPYSLAGVQYLGTGLEVKFAEKWKVMSMYGRTRKEVNYDSLNPSRLANYRRMVGGAKLEFNSNGDKIAVSFMGGQDQLSSLAFKPDIQNVKPEENVVWDLEFSKLVFKKLTFTGEYARSAYTKDLRSEASTEKSAAADPLFLINKKQSTSYYNALKAGANMNFGPFTLGAGYERIDPNYKTLGAYYFNNDLENVTLNTSMSLFHRKINIAGSVGKQHDNLNKAKLTTQTRTVGSYSLSMIPVNKVNISLSYSNFSNYMNIMPQYRTMTALTPYDNLDTLNYVQIAQSYSGSANWQMKADKITSSTLNYSTSFQQTNDKRGNTAFVAGTKVQNHNLNYAHSRTHIGLTFSLGANANIISNTNMNNLLTGPNLNVAKTFFQKKLNASLGTTYNLSFDKGINTSRLLSLRNNYSISFQKKHAFNLAFVYVDSKQKEATPTATLKTFSNMTITAGYNYTFSAGKNAAK
jgi:hypothetical protein